MDYILSFSLLTLLSHMVFIFLAFWALKALMIEKWIRKGHVREARLLYFFLAIALGYTVSSFFLNFIEISQSVSFLITK
ncbi:DUF1146 family protein [Jeotgalibaca sp. MA1X17-3]|uniref:DUF1146 family protein n=1 Tax=Jeotgalibaca sp. MA1X17-3 TaxID=2908211 RepID=UPI001F483458|nr:DUF1146 family protein [Jeotgalibaca sp. MA1X17-3]UJF16553.1 DUF1146 family protein [Jeotgalibaca sp. MA1X17-3]